MSSLQVVPLPPKTDRRWAAIVTEGTSRPIRLLALKFMIARMTQDVRRDPSAATIAKNVDELHGYFAKNPRVVRDDTATLFGA